MIKDRAIKELVYRLRLSNDYILRLENATGSKLIDRPNILDNCRLLNSIEGNFKHGTIKNK